MPLEFLNQLQHWTWNLVHPAIAHLGKGFVRENRYDRTIDISLSERIISSDYTRFGW